MGFPWLARINRRKETRNEKGTIVSFDFGGSIEVFVKHSWDTICLDSNKEIVTIRREKWILLSPALSLSNFFQGPI